MAQYLGFMFHHAPQYSELTLTHIRDSATHSGDMPKFGFPFVTECVWPTRTKLEGEDHAGSFPIARPQLLKPDLAIFTFIMC